MIVPEHTTAADDRLASCEAVLFDFDGTLIDTGPLILESFRYTAERFLDEVPPDELLMRNVGVPLRTQMEALKPGSGDEMVACYREHNHAVHDTLARPFPHVDEVLGEMRSRGVPMGVVTSKGRTAFGMGSRLIGLDRYIEVTVTADDVDLHKPHPKPLEVCAERLGIRVGRTMYLGDSVHDVTAALRAGSIAVAALWGGMFTEEALIASGPDYALQEIRQLLALMEDGSRFAV